MAAQSPANTTDAQVSFDKVRQSVEQALLKEKQNTKREVITQYIKDASVRMRLNLSIIPHEIRQKNKNTKLPQLRAREKSDESCMTKRNQYDTAKHMQLDYSIKYFPLRCGIHLPPIPNTLALSQNNHQKRKRRRKKHKNVPEKSKNVHLLPQKTLEKCSHTAGTTDNPLSVVMLGQSTNDATKYGADTLHKLVVSKHGRFKSK